MRREREKSGFGKTIRTALEKEAGKGIEPLKSPSKQCGVRSNSPPSYHSHSSPFPSLSVPLFITPAIAHKSEPFFHGPYKLLDQLLTSLAASR